MAAEKTAGAGGAGSLGEEQYCFPATIAQQSFWYLDQLEPGNPAWNIAVRFRIEGPLDPALLHEALGLLAARHETLRTTFSLVGEEPSQIVHAQATLPLPLDDLSHLSGAARDAEEERRTIAEGERRFDLDKGPLFRARLLRLAPAEHILLITIHHIVSDGWSIGVISGDLAAFYRDLAAGRMPQLPPLSLQFADYAIWQNQRLQQDALAPHRDYWSARLANLPRCEVPPDHPRPPVKTHNGYILSTLLPGALTKKLTGYAHSQDCTLYTVALAALMALLSQAAGQRDVVAGTLVAGRDRVELEPLVGVFINTLVLRTDLSGDPAFPELLRLVRQTAEEAMAHQDLPFQQLVEMLRPPRDLSRPTLYSVNFIYQRDFVHPESFAGLTMTPLPSKSPGAIYDLNFFMVERADGWRLSCEYNTDLYEAATVQRLLTRLERLLAAIAGDPGRKMSELLAAASLPAAQPASNGFRH